MVSVTKAASRASLRRSGFSPSSTASRTSRAFTKPTIVSSPRSQSG